MRIPEVIVMDILQAHIQRIGIPLVYESRTRLIWFSLLSGKGNQMDARIVEVMYGKSRNGNTCRIVYDVTPDAFRTVQAHAVIVADIFLLEGMFYGNLIKTLDEFRLVHPEQLKTREGEKLFSRSLGALVPRLEIVFGQSGNTGIYEMRTGNPQPFPLGSRIRRTPGNP